MTSSLASRVGRIISGSMNLLVDAMEDAAPAVVLEQSIREIDQAMEEVRSELGRTVAAKHLANTRLMAENRRHEELSGQIELAVREGRDDLAEAAIARQMDIEAQIPVLEQALSESAEKERELEGYMAALRAKARDMAEELRQWRESRREAEAATPGSGADGRSGAQNVEAAVRRAEAAFDRVLQRSTGTPSAARSDLGGEQKLAELEALSRQHRIQERLAALKAREGGGR